MTEHSKLIDLQYVGFINTPILWHEDMIFGLNQFQIPEQKTLAFDGVIDPNLRLGKCVERFVFHQLKSNKDIEVVAENLQIQRGKLTLGELDCLLKFNNRPIHLEIVYKFYLYDPSVGDTDLEHWIGPNRKDSLIKKASKLKDKQLPNLYAPETKLLLDQLNIESETIEQFVNFRAQLFVPLNLLSHSFEQINNECIKGVYIKQGELEQFTECKFYIPTKINWLMEVQVQTNWMEFERFSAKIESILSQQTSPLCWIKYSNGEVIKCFIVWW